MQNNKVFKMAATAMLTAMIFLLTRFVTIPLAVGYVHFGDALVYITASVIGGPYALFAAAVGEALADITAGWVAYAPATMIIKILIALPFVFVHKKSDRILTPITALLTIPSGIITVAGYFAADMIIDKAYAFTNIAGNAVQAVGSAVIFIILGAAFDTTGIKKKLFMEKKNG